MPLRIRAFSPLSEHLQHLNAVVKHAAAGCCQAYERLSAAVDKYTLAEFFRQIKQGVAA